jgi:hypothetical protein
VQSLVSSFIFGIFFALRIDFRMTLVRFTEKLWNVVIDEQSALYPSVLLDENGRCFRIINKMQLLQALQSSDNPLKRMLLFLFLFFFLF